MDLICDFISGAFIFHHAERGTVCLEKMATTRKRGDQAGLLAPPLQARGILMQSLRKAIALTASAELTK
jgi:hypothetical protein